MLKKINLPAGHLEDAERSRLLIDAVTDYAIYMLDPQGVVSSWNGGAQRFKGYTPEEIVGRHFSTFYVEEDRARGKPQRALAIAAGEGKFEDEGWRVRKDGSRFWASVVITPIRAAGGALIGFAKVTRDLTERRKAEEELRRSDNQFRLLVEGVTDYALYMLDAEGRVASWNTGAQRIKGYAPDEIIGKHISTFYTAEDRQADIPQQGLATAARVGRFEKEGWRVRKDGSRFWANVVIDAIHDEHGKLIGFAKITRDITERTEALKALERAREELLQSQKMEAIGQLTGGVAHDFNNLLAIILGSLDLLRRRIDADPKTDALLDNAIQAANRGAALTKRMLAFARRQDLTPTPIDIPALLQDMNDLLQRSIGPRSPIEMRFSLGLPAVLGDRNQLEMALLNLALNARDAMPDGGPIEISAHERIVGAGEHATLKPGRYVALAVSDSGIGMDSVTMARAAEPFFTTKGVGKGTGLGLSMVHGMAEQLGGRFGLISEVGKGTRAEIWLPAANSATAPAAALPDQTRGAEGPGRALTVLAVDDDQLVLMNTVSMLEDLGHQALAASSAANGLAMLEKHPVDLVITDQAMPEMTGLQLADKLKAERSGLPVIIATGYADLPGNASEQVITLAKPFWQQDLASVIARAMAQKR